VLQHVDRAEPGFDLVRRPQRRGLVGDVSLEPGRLDSVGGQVRAMPSSRSRLRATSATRNPSRPNRRATAIPRAGPAP